MVFFPFNYLYLAFSGSLQSGGSRLWILVKYLRDVSLVIFFLFVSSVVPSLALWLVSTQETTEGMLLISGGFNKGRIYKGLGMLRRWNSGAITPRAKERELLPESERVTGIGSSRRVRPLFLELPVGQFSWKPGAGVLLGVGPRGQLPGAEQRGGGNKGVEGKQKLFSTFQQRTSFSYFSLSLSSSTTLKISLILSSSSPTNIIFYYRICNVKSYLIFCFTF